MSYVEKPYIYGLMTDLGLEFPVYCCTDNAVGAIVVVGLVANGSGSDHVASFVECAHIANVKCGALSGADANTGTNAVA